MIPSFCYSKSRLLFILLFLLSCLSSYFSNSQETQTQILTPTQYDNLDRDNTESLQIMWRLFNSPPSIWTPITPSSPINDAPHRTRMFCAPSYLSASDRVSSDRHECVRAQGIIDASPDVVFGIIQQNDLIIQSNENLLRIDDIHFFPRSFHLQYDSISKVAISRAMPKVMSVPIVKPREFHSIVSFIRFFNGSYAIINRPAYIAPEYSLADASSVVRGSMLFACNLIEPYGEKQTKLTQFLQINPGGAADSDMVAWVLNRKQLATYVYISKINAIILRARENSGRPAVSLWSALLAARKGFLK